MADPTNKYKVVKLMIEKQYITIFSQITDYVPKSVIATELQTNSTRLNRLLADPLSFKLNELIIIAKRIQIPVDKIIELIFVEEKNKYLSKRSNTKSTKRK